MTATYTFEVFCSLDAFGSARESRPGYWGKQGPELLDHRLAVRRLSSGWSSGAGPLRCSPGCLLGATEASGVRHPWVPRMRSLPATVISTTLRGPLDWPDATVLRGDAVEVVASLKEESDAVALARGCPLTAPAFYCPRLPPAPRHGQRRSGLLDVAGMSQCGY